MKWIVFADGRIVGSVDAGNETEAKKKATIKFNFLRASVFVVEPAAQMRKLYQE
jgi:hypothetical protein